jgi:hypothetical protein
MSIAQILDASSAHHGSTRAVAETGASTASPSRRDFIAVVGGGVILAAQVAMPALAHGPTGPVTPSAVESEFPADTVQAWRGPALSSSPAADPRRQALAYAILAPNPHNRQPWLVDLREAGVITLYADRTRLLPETDPFGRQILIGHGAFVELLAQALAQQGLATAVQLFPQGDLAPALTAWDDRPVARITLGAPGSAKPDPLFAQVLKRHTPKTDFDPQRPVASAQLQALRLAANGTAANSAAPQCGGTVDPASLDPLRRLCWESAQVELLTPRTVMETMRLIRVGPDEIRANPDGVTLNGKMERFLAAVGLFDRSAPPVAGTQAFKSMMGRFEGYSNTAMGFVWLTTATNTRADQVNAGRAYVRLQLQATASGLGVHPMSQALQEFPEMRPFHTLAHDLVLGKTRQPGQTVQMLCRLGYTAKPAGATPRRDVAAFVRA